MVEIALSLDTNLTNSITTGALAGFGVYGAVPLLATASTGTAISSLSGAAATNATLAWLGGGSIATGGFGMAGGMVALGGIVAGPALAVGGFMLASKAEEQLTEAEKYKAQVDVEIGKMKNIETALNGLQKNAEETTHIIKQLTQAYDKVRVNNKNSHNIEKMYSIARVLKETLNQKIMDNDGEPVEGLKQKYNGYLKILGEVI